MENTIRESFEEFIKRNTPQKGVVTKEIWEVPLPSHNGYLSNKDVDYNLLGGLILMSNFDGLQNRYEGNRYMYKNSFDTEGIQSLCGISESTVKRNFNKLKRALPKEDAEKALITVENTEHGAVYKINFATEGKYFVTIPSVILHYLVKATNKEVIRLYVFFLVQLANGPKQMQREYIADAIGINKDSTKALDNVSLLTNSLVAHGLLTKSSRVEFFFDGEREVPKTLVTYGLTTFEEFMEHYNSLTKKSKQQKTK